MLQEIESQELELQEIDLNLWVAQQPLRYFGLGIRTRMTVIRFANDELVIISPIRLNPKAIQQLDDLGKVSHIIAPNLYHYMFAADFQAQYPDSIFWATPGLKEKEPDLAIDKTIGEENFPFASELKSIFFDGFRTLVPSGFESLNEWVFCHVATRTLIITDAAFNFDRTFPWSTQLAARASGIYNRLSPSLLEKLAITEKETLRSAVASILDWDFDRVIMAHGQVVECGGKQAFSHAYSFLL
ncbi:MAG: DUF4336 domain-containing protein [Cyanobacteria bacterium P01_D01_bin.105]